ncbi:13249_t:CDS:2, partial [Entrophospora sp. SA101]
TFAETDDNDNESEGEGETSFFINSETIPEDNCIILVENIWIEKFIGDYDNSDIDEYENANMTNEDGKGILDYDIDSLL